MRKKKTIEEFINESIKIHGDKYDYSLVNYVNYNTKVKIICKIHGIFEQTPNKHLRTSGCSKCNGNKKLTTEEFIEKSKNIHGDKYDYSKVNYINYNTKVKIICKKHGIFKQTPKSHISNMSGCKKCSYENLSTKYSKDSNHFINKSRKIHGNKYDYFLVKYITAKVNVKIICPKHGIFEQTPSNHHKGFGCDLCGNESTHIKLKKSNTQFIKDSIKTHEHKYNYSMVDYFNATTKVKIICKKHGVFEQTPNSHLSGHGCPVCKESKGEKFITKFLKKNNLNYTKQKKFNDCIDKNKLPFDFYLDNLNMCIEYDGIQHFKPIEYFGGVENLNYVKKHDKIKTKFCEEKNIKLLRIKYTDNIEEKMNFIFNEKI